MKKYYSLEVFDKKADLYIYGDITSFPWIESDVSSYLLSKQIEEIDTDEINVYINSYGGEVAEGLAIFNNLKRHKAKINTYCDGFACSAASMVFMAGDERIMYPASLLMIHNAWTYTAGDSNQLKKDAERLETITKAAKESYLSKISISEEELTQMLDNETWLDSKDCLEKGFSTKIEEYDSSYKESMSARNNAFVKMTTRENNFQLSDTITKQLKEIKQELSEIKAKPTTQKSVFNFRRTE